MVKLLDRNDYPITYLNEWPEPQKKDQWKLGRSAMELARFWTETHKPDTVPLLYRNLLNQKFPVIQFHEGRPEFGTLLPPKGSRGPRMHDLHLWSTWSGGSLTVCVEGKADEPFGETVCKEVKNGETAKRTNGRSQKPQRLQELLKSVWGVTTPTREQCALRYQLLAALVGTAIQTLYDQKKAQAGKGVLIVHVFETHLTTRDNLDRNHQDLENFARALPNVTIPPSGIKPDCLYGPATVTVPADFAPSGISTPVSVYLAKLVTVCCSSSRTSA